MTDLITRLEAATEGSRELSDECLLVMGWTQDYVSFPGGHKSAGKIWTTPDGKAGLPEAPDPTRSLDDAMELVPEDVTWRVKGGPRKGQISAWAAGWEGYANAPALALCIAALKARQAQEKADG